MNEPAVSLPWAQRPWRLVTIVEGTFSLSGFVARRYLDLVILFFSGAITRPLSGNSNSFRDVGEAPLVQYLGIAVYLGGILLGLWSLIQRQRQGRLSISPPFIAYGLLALWVALSVCWSPLPDLGARRSIAFIGTVVVAFAIATALPARDIVRALVRFSVGLILATLILRIALPIYAVHQAGELGVAEHAGRLRGSFAHKNELARTLLLALVVLMAFGRRCLPNRIIWGGVLAIGLLLEVMSGSAKVLVILPLVEIVARFVAMRAPIPVRWLLVLGLAILVSILWLSGILALVEGLVLESVGRGTDMSGRTLIWQVAWKFYAEHPWIGQGYATGWASGAEAYFARLKLIVIGHAHNGYINTLLDLGLIGLVLALVPLVLMAFWLMRFPRAIGGQLRCFASGWLVAYVMMNLSGTYLVNYNDLYTFTTILCCFWCYGVFHFRVDILSLIVLSR